MDAQASVHPFIWWTAIPDAAINLSRYRLIVPLAIGAILSAWDMGDEPRQDRVAYLVRDDDARKAAMRKPTVLAIGLDPRFADYRAMPQFTPELVRAYIEAEINRLRDAGFEVDTCLLTADATAEYDVEAALRSTSASDAS